MRAASWRWLRYRWQMAWPRVSQKPKAAQYRRPNKRGGVAWRRRLVIERAGEKAGIDANRRAFSEKAVNKYARARSRDS